MTATMMKPEVRHSIACPTVEVDPWIVEEDDSPPNNTTVWYDPDKNKRSPQLPPAIMMTSCDVKKVRRKSWHAIRFERKRKKGVVETNVPTVNEQLIVTAGQLEEDNNNSEDLDVDIGPLPPPRQKRPSWWNIFANQPRTRRASQDVNAVTRSTENFPIWTRSKSRSVDHGISAPFDIDALRSKVDGHVEKHLDRDIDGSTNSLSERKKAGPPENTTTYIVADRDTLTSVAARFDTTPSELTKLNRLATPFIFPGQQLYVPLRVLAEDGSDSSTPVEDSRDRQHDDLPADEKELLDNLRPVSPKPGHAERVRTPSGGTYPTLSSSLDSNESQSLTNTYPTRPTAHHHSGVAVPTRGSSIYKQFLKINVRHITDGQGVVGGVLLVTHNAVMFDPNVSDTLVIEHGPEAYGVIAPMEFVVNAAIYNDIAHMRVGHVDHSKLLQHSDSDGDKPEIYYPKAEREPELPEQNSLAETETETPTETEGADDGEKAVDSLLVKDETFPELGTSIICGNDDTESVCSCTEREGDAFPKAFDRDLVTPTNIEDLEGGHSGGVTPQLQTPRTAEERRKSLLDHHWAIPSRDRSSVDADELLPSAVNANSSPGPASNTSAEDQQDDDLLINTSAKPSCHDSGIDIRDAGLPPVVPLQTKKVYSDADIVLSREWVPPITIPPTQVTSQDGNSNSVSSSVLSSSLIMNNGSPARKKTSSVSFTLDNSVEEILEEEGEEADKKDDAGKGAQGETKKNKMLKRLSYPMSWIETFSGDNKDCDEKITQPHSADAAGQHPGHSSSMFSKVFSRRSSVGTFIRQPTEGSKNNKQTAAPQPKLDYKSMVSVEDMPELFVSFDKLIPRPARSCEDPPLYLRLRMGKPLDRPIPHSTPLMSYGKKKMRPEYWFSIPKNRVDELYNFINSWVPHLYGELNEEHVTMRGYSLVEADTELWSDEATPSASRHGSQDGDIADISRESWEVLPMSDDLRRALYSTGTPGASLDIDLTPPDIIGTTEVLTYAHRESLCRHLPARAEGYVWTLAFSTSRDGFSLNSMYRKMHKLESPVLMVIMDTDNNVFGALTSCALQVSDHFYGTGESLLYRFTPQFQVFNWTGENLYFIKGNNESLSIGAGDGKFGLWLDGDLYQGRTETCQTYANEPLSPNVDFVVKTLECFVFV